MSVASVARMRLSEAPFQGAMLCPLKQALLAPSEQGALPFIFKRNFSSVCELYIVNIFVSLERYIYIYVQ